MSAPAPGLETPGHDGPAPLVSRTRALLAASPRARRLALVAVVLAVVLGVVLWRHFAARESTDDAQIDGHIVPIAARVGGTVSAVDVADNEPIAVGTVVLQIDQRDFRVALQRAEAELAEAQAALEGAEAGVPIAATTTQSQTTNATASVERARAGLAATQARLTAAAARLREATANAVRAQRDLDRMNQLVAKDEVSQQQVDLAVAAAAAASATVEAAQAAVAEAEQGRDNAAGVLTQAGAELSSAGTGPHQVTVTRARAEAARARLELARSALDMARLNLEYTTLKSPAAGIVSKKSVEPGAVVAPGQPLLAIVGLDDVWVTANFKETQLRSMHPGQPAVVRVDAYGRSYKARVESIAAATGARFSLLPPENATGNYVKVVQRVPVKIVLEKGQDAEHLLRPGMSVIATVITST